ncbi:hypothetical protein COO60DRAFT_594150 [Scenedesmus sp. NREL 46B-D3]|nr:hypothetical protein COO60DRAFT_594150 [Scenedesmus sp. NREL 46B-D3]
MFDDVDECSWVVAVYALPHSSAIEYLCGTGRSLQLHLLMMVTSPAGFKIELRAADQSPCLFLCRRPFVSSRLCMHGWICSATLKQLVMVRSLQCPDNGTINAIRCCMAHTSPQQRFEGVQHFLTFARSSSRNSRCMHSSSRCRYINLLHVHQFNQWRSTAVPTAVGGASFAYMRSLACRGGETLLACLPFCCCVKVLLLVTSRPGNR